MLCLFYICVYVCEYYRYPIYHSVDTIFSDVRFVYYDKVATPSQSQIVYEIERCINDNVMLGAEQQNFFICSVTSTSWNIY